MIDALATALAGRYRLEREIGAGGMATVHLAEDLRHHRQVAIKVLRPELASALGPDRFLREIETTANLRHPHILPLYDSGDADGFLFYVMPFVEGDTLRDRLTSEKQLPLPDVLRLAREIAEALGYAHERGVIHRDIKPENVLLERGHAVVADFGIARAVSKAGGEKLTQTGMAVGTPLYMSPEQAAGSDALDARSDLYSLGCLVYEMLAGTPPFSGSTALVLLARHALDPVPPLESARPGLPPHIVRAVEALLAKSPADRSGSAEAWLAALDGASLVAPAEGSPAGAGTGTGTGTSSLALGVLPIKGHGDEDLEALAEGLTDDLAAGLARFPHLVVVPCSPEPGTDTLGTATRLGVRYLLRAQLRRAGNAIRLSVRVVDAVRNQPIWSESYDRDLAQAGVFEIQDDLADRIVATVADGYGALVRSMCDVLTGISEDDYGPAEWVLRHFEYLQRVTPSEHARFREAVERAIERGAGEAELCACQALSCLHESGFGFNQRPRALDRALAAAQRAVEIDRTSQLAYQILAQTHFFRRDLSAFRPAAERAMALNARDGNTMAILGLQLEHIGEYQRGAAIVRRAIEMNPHHAGWYHFGPLWEHFQAGQYEQALARAMQVNMPGLFWVPVAVAACNSYLGRALQARRAVDELLVIDPDFARHARANIESWHYASGLLERLIEGLRQAGLAIVEGGGPAATA